MDDREALLASLQLLESLALRSWRLADRLKRELAESLAAEAIAADRRPEKSKTRGRRRRSLAARKRPSR